MRVLIIDLKWVDGGVSLVTHPLKLCIMILSFLIT